MKSLNLILLSSIGLASLSTAAFAAAPSKVAICHFSDEDGTFALKNVPAPAVNGHLKHGDVLAPAEAATATVTLDDGTVITLDAQCAEVVPAEGA